MIVADTHAIVWWTLEPDRLGKRAAIELAEADRIGVPSIALWETSLLVRKGKLRMRLAVSEWANRLLAIPRVDLLPLTAAIAVRADTLEMQADPADRFIVATALEHKARLVTKDAEIRRLGLIDTIW